MYKYNLSTKETLAVALELMQLYGGDITVRQIYYQLVARGYEKSADQVYKRLGRLLSQARKTGEIPPWLLQDRSRTLYKGDYEEHPFEQNEALHFCDMILKDLPNRATSLSRWYGQEKFVSVCYEKDALSGIFAQICGPLGLSFMACKGYPSVSAVWSFIETWSHAASFGLEDAVVLYFGDHDPEGINIPQALESNIRTFRDRYMEDLSCPIAVETLGSIKVHRLALTREQIDQHSLPSFSAKKKSPRYASYVEKHGTECWELDALPPDILKELVESETAKHFDLKVFRKHQSHQISRREEVKQGLIAKGYPL